MKTTYWVVAVMVLSCVGAGKVSLPPGFEGKCGICKTTVEELRNFITSDTTEAQLVDFIDKVRVCEV